ncbi:OmpA family protein [uncultured Roseobacter sp.]|uniref:OmpA family protein n=1 Tax=uncultured Roseobacter sp. TaxID=114847 RepID=UPI0034500D68
MPKTGENSDQERSRRTHRPPLHRRAFVGAVLSACCVGTLSTLGLIGARDAPETASFTFSRGTTFDVGQEQELREYLARLAADARIAILLSGHTGTRGDQQANIALSRSRARAVALIAQDLGISQDRIRIAATGNAQPLPRPAGLSDREYQSMLARVTVSTQVVR